MRVMVLIEDVPRTRAEIPKGEPTGGVDVQIACDSRRDAPPETPALRLARRIKEIVEAETEPDGTPSGHDTQGGDDGEG